MNPRTFLAGLALGFLLGWVVFDRKPPGASPPPTPKTAPPPSPEPQREPTPQPEPAQSVRRLPHPRAREMDLTSIAAQLRRGRDTGDRGIWNQAVFFLCRDGSPEAHAMLLEILRDETLTGLLRGGGYLEALRHSDVPGIPAAARRRFEMNLEAGENSWVGAEGWLDLVAEHGDEEDLEWLLLQSQSGQIRARALSSLLTSTNPLALRRARRLVEEGRSLGPMGDTRWIRDAPAEAFALLERANPHRSRGDYGRVSGPSTLLRLWSGSVKAGEVAAAQEYLLGLESPALRIAAVYAVADLLEKGAQRGHFEELLLYPVLVLEGTDEKLRSSARYAIEYNPITWSERAARALDRGGYAMEARKVRAKLNTPWKEDD